MNLRARPRRSCSSTPTKTTSLPRPALRRLGRASGASCVHGAQYDCQKLSTTTLPRSDASESVPGRVDARARERRRRDDLLRVDLLRDLAAASVREIPDEQPEQAEHDGDGGDLRDAAHQTMKTVVPTSTWSKSHSASGTCIRMQPCEAL